MARAKKDFPETYFSPFATRLRELMAEGPTTQDQLATAAGKTRQTISQYVNGISEPGYNTLVKIADYYGTSIDYLLGRTNDPDKVPCAADELGLSKDSIDAIKYFAEYSSDALRGLNLLLKSFEFWAVCLMVEELRKNVEALPDDRIITNDFVIQSEIEEEILTGHPELRGKIQVLYGDLAISAISDRIEKLFSEALYSASGQSKRQQR